MVVTFRVSDDGSRAVYAAGQLLFQRGLSVFARPFDASRLVFTGPERLLTAQAGFFSVSDNGMVVYKPERPTLSQVTWFDRRGRSIGTVAEPGQYQQVVLSSRGRRATVVRYDTQGSRGSMDLWDVDLTSGVLSRLTTDPARASDPSWSPDSRRIVFEHYLYGGRSYGSSPQSLSVVALNDDGPRKLTFGE